MKKFAVTCLMCVALLGATKSVSARQCFDGDGSCTDTQSSQSGSTGSEWDQSARAVIMVIMMLMAGAGF